MTPELNNALMSFLSGGQFIMTVFILYVAVKWFLKIVKFVKETVKGGIIYSTNKVNASTSRGNENGGY